MCALSKRRARQSSSTGRSYTAKAALQGVFRLRVTDQVFSVRERGIVRGAAGLKVRAGETAAWRVTPGVCDRQTGGKLTEGRTHEG